jgi:hypothetical protein
MFIGFSSFTTFFSFLSFQMSFLFSIDPATAELAELDRRRDLLRSQMEDRDLEKVATSEDEARRSGVHPKSAKDRWAKRQSRRAWETRMGFYPIPPGPWSFDLDEFHDEKGYTFDFGDGYTGRLVRSMEATYNGYVTLPEGHPLAGLGYNIFDQDSTLEIPQPPKEMTFGAGREFGYDHSHQWGVKPVPNRLPRYDAYNYYSCSEPVVGSGYVDYFCAAKELKQLYEYFKMVETDHWEAIAAWRSKKRRPNPAAVMERRRLLTTAAPAAAPAAAPSAAAPAAAPSAAAPSAAPPSAAPAVKRSWAAVVKNK